jgi:RNA polymerase subunit RPABC4/transcription elongation factor Spt4
VVAPVDKGDENDNFIPPFPVTKVDGMEPRNEGTAARNGQETDGLTGIEGRLHPPGGDGRCTRCGVFIQDDYLVCPYCALTLKKECPRCHRQIHLKWNACAYCGHVIVPIIPPDSDRLKIDLPPPGDGLPVQVMVSGKVLLRGRCPRCVHLIMDDARYCDSCGLKVEDRLLRPITGSGERPSP